MFQQSIYRSLGLSAHLAWARLLIDRTNEQIKYPDAESNRRKSRVTEMAMRMRTKATSTRSLALRLPNAPQGSAPKCSTRPNY